MEPVVAESILSIPYAEFYAFGVVLDASGAFVEDSDGLTMLDYFGALTTTAPVGLIALWQGLYEKWVALGAPTIGAGLDDKWGTFVEDVNSAVSLYGQQS